MIEETLTVLADQLNRYVRQDEMTEIVETRNVAVLSSDDFGTANGKVFLTLVNLAEETVLRNGPDYRITSDNRVRYQNWPVHLNLFLLFSCPGNSSDQETYQTSLGRLSRVVEFFQANRDIIFSQIALPDSLSDRTDLLDMCISMDLHTLNFEQINDLWGSLGGRQFPFVMYKARLVRLEMQRPKGEGRAIVDISQELSHLS